VFSADYASQRLSDNAPANRLYGYWSERLPLQNLFDDAKVAGTVRLKLYKGACYLLGRKSPFLSS
jgi:argininosuccinate synthase